MKKLTHEQKMDNATDKLDEASMLLRQMKKVFADINSTSVKIEEETWKVKLMCVNVINEFNSAAMTRAIVNADRLAKALESISSTKEQRISLNLRRKV